MISKQKGILVFAANSVGRDVVKFLLKNNFPLSMVIWSSGDYREIAELSKQSGVRFSYYTPKCQHTLINSLVTYSWLLNVWSAHILTSEVLDIADHKLNIHPGIVPQFRGNDNAAWTIRKGGVAGVSLLEMTEQLDAGAIYAQTTLNYKFGINGGELNRRLKLEAVELFKKKWPDIYTNKCIPVEQQGQISLFSRQNTNHDRQIHEDSQWQAKEFLQWVLAHDFSPGTTAEMCIDGKNYRVRVFVEPMDGMG